MMKRPSSTNGSAGFSLIEALIAASLLLLVAVGLLPLFANAMVQNKKGNDSTVVTNHSKTMVEDMGQLPLDSPRLTIASGSTETLVDEYWNEGDIHVLGDANEGWATGSIPSGQVVPWSRQVTVRQFSLDDLDGDFEFDTPLDGAAIPIDVDLKEIQVQIIPRRQAGSPLGRGTQMTLRTYKFVG